MMPLDVLGHARAILNELASVLLTGSYVGVDDLVKLDCTGDRPLQLLVFNKELLPSKSKLSAYVDYVPALSTHLVATTD